MLVVSVSHSLAMTQILNFVLSTVEMENALFLSVMTETIRMEMDVAKTVSWSQAMCAGEALQGLQIAVYFICLKK